MPQRRSNFYFLFIFLLHNQNQNSNQCQFTIYFMSHEMYEEIITTLFCLHRDI